MYADLLALTVKRQAPDIIKKIVNFWPNVRCFEPSVFLLGFSAFLLLVRMGDKKGIIARLCAFGAL